MEEFDLGHLSVDMRVRAQGGPQQAPRQGHGRYVGKTRSHIAPQEGGAEWSEEHLLGQQLYMDIEDRTCGGREAGRDPGQGSQPEYTLLTNIDEVGYLGMVEENEEIDGDKEAQLLGYALSQEISGAGGPAAKRGEDPLGGILGPLDDSDYGQDYWLGEIANRSFNDPYGIWENGPQIFPTQREGGGGGYSRKQPREGYPGEAGG